ncbi:MAG: hypothetical protein WA020_14755 [Candidatus Acidiferrales bacterium]
MAALTFQFFPLESKTIRPDFHGKIVPASPWEIAALPFGFSFAGFHVGKARLGSEPFTPMR